MTDERWFRGLLHRATHRIPGVPAHAEPPAGHQARADRDGGPRPSLNRRWNHSPARPPRVMAAWQNRIAAYFGQDPR